MKAAGSFLTSLARSEECIPTAMHTYIHCSYIHTYIQVEDIFDFSQGRHDEAEESVGAALSGTELHTYIHICFTFEMRICIDTYIHVPYRTEGHLYLHHRLVVDHWNRFPATRREK